MMMANMNVSFSSNGAGLKDLVDAGISSVPPKYVFPSRRQEAGQSITISTSDAPWRPPVIDLAPLSSPVHRKRTVEQIGEACTHWGLFQVVNHGVPVSTRECLFSAANKFFSLPVEERLPFYLDDPRNKRENSVNWKETIACSREFKAPAICIEPALEYKSKVKELAKMLYGAILESLGVEANEKKAEEHMALCNMLMHYYPPCPDPNLTFGLSEHTDAGFITILLQDQVGGLEVLKNDRWIRCDPVQNALTINIADQMEILSNGRYASALHRVQTNSEKPRLSVPCFLTPAFDAKIGPLAELIDEKNPALYKEVVFGDYLNNSTKLRFSGAAPSGLDFAKI